MEAIICIGSNLNESIALVNIQKAIELLKCENTKFQSESDIYPSESGYMNYVATCHFPIDYNEAHVLTKRIEKALGRTPEMKERGIVPIDIDIVVHDSIIERPADFRCAYFKKGLSSQHPL